MFNYRPCLGQLYKLYGRSVTDRVLQNLTAVFISHQHTDHHMGLTSLILARQRIFRGAGKPVENLFIICTGFFAYMMISYHVNVQPILTHAVLVKSKSLENGVQLLSHDQLFGTLLKKSGLSELRTCEADHGVDAFSISFRTAKDYKVTYSGDTRPNDRLVQIGRYSHLLIHEATFSNGSPREAKLAKHSLTSEAIEVGKTMKAGKYILFKRTK